MQHRSREIPLSFAVPLIEHASLEEDDDLQDIWARMLANAADAGSGMERRTAFIDMLKRMSAAGVQILAEIAKVASSQTGGAVHMLNFPDIEDQTDRGRRFMLPPHVSASLENLVRLGCIHTNAGFSGTHASARITDLGAAFIVSCTSASI